MLLGGCRIRSRFVQLEQTHRRLAAARQADTILDAAGITIPAVRKQAQRSVRRNNVSVMHMVRIRPKPTGVCGATSTTWVKKGHALSGMRSSLNSVTMDARPSAHSSSRSRASKRRIDETDGPPGGASPGAWRQQTKHLGSRNGQERETHLRLDIWQPSVGLARAFVNQLRRLRIPLVTLVRDPLGRGRRAVRSNCLHIGQGSLRAGLCAETKKVRTSTARLIRNSLAGHTHGTHTQLKQIVCMCGNFQRPFS